MRTAAIVLISIAMQAQSPTRDAPATAQLAGTAVISGQVVSEEDPARPIRLAKVELSTSALRRELMATTDSKPPMPRAKNKLWFIKVTQGQHRSEFRRYD